MKTEELRIGNLVEYEGEIFQMNFLSKEGPPLLDTLKFGYGVVEWNDLKPIQLTEDWLVKFGFELILKNDAVKQATKGRLSLCLSPSFIGMYYPYEYLEIKHLHQLQNLYFALIGEELTIK